jgi:hypothetical protein
VALMLRGYRSDLGGVGFTTNSRIELYGAEADGIDFGCGWAYALRHGRRQGVSPPSGAARCGAAGAWAGSNENTLRVAKNVTLDMAKLANTRKTKV